MFLLHQLANAKHGRSGKSQESELQENCKICREVIPLDVVSAMQPITKIDNSTILVTI